LHPRIYRTYWTSNAYYAGSEQQSKGGIFNALLRIANAIAYLESRLCWRIRFGATAVHLTARKSA